MAGCSQTASNCSSAKGSGAGMTRPTLALTGWQGYLTLNAKGICHDRTPF